MKTLKYTGDIWDLTDHLIVVPINLQGVMGRGIALQAKEKYKGVQDWIRDLMYTSDVHWTKRLPVYENKLIMFPVKYSWQDKADIDLILRSAHGLIGVTEKYTRK